MTVAPRALQVATTKAYCCAQHAVLGSPTNYIDCSSQVAKMHKHRIDLLIDRWQHALYVHFEQQYILDVDKPQM